MEIKTQNRKINEKQVTMKYLLYSHYNGLQNSTEKQSKDNYENNSDYNNNPVYLQIHSF